MANAFQLGTIAYPLDHLERFRVVVPAKDPLASAATLEVTFSHHVFSEKWDDAVHTAVRAYEAEGGKRAFCPVRYGCSINLRAIVEYHVAGKAFLSRDGKGTWNHLFYGEADSIPYPVFFRLRKANRIEGVHGILHVISAYQNPELPSRNRLQSIKFPRLVHQTCPPLIAK